MLKLMHGATLINMCLCNQIRTVFATYIVVLVAMSSGILLMLAKRHCQLCCSTVGKSTIELYVSPHVAK